MSEPVRYLSSEDFDRPHPVHAVWELTLACDLKCNHCGSRAQKARPDELTTDEALDVVRQLAKLGCREVTLIGGEAYLRKDWTTVIRAIRQAGMKATLQSGARNLTRARIDAAVEAGLQAVGVSIDGLAEIHDEIRGVEGSFDRALEALAHCRDRGLDISVNTQIHSKILADLPAMLDQFIALGVKSWQIQLTVAMGRAADNDEVLIQPYQLLEIMPLLFSLFEKGRAHGLLLIPGNNLGYFGPYEAHWRGGEDHTHFIGCNAGQNTLGIEADGTIKGCPSLPTSVYAGGNVRDLDIEKIWNESPQLAFTRNRTTADLWGHCRSCYYAEVCKAGCSWTTHTLLGRPGNNPYCHYRALQLDARGLRERIVKVKQAPGLPFDYGGFELVEEPKDSPERPVLRAGHRRLPVVA